MKLTFTLSALLLTGCAGMHSDDYWYPNPFLPEPRLAITKPVIYTTDLSKCPRAAAAEFAGRMVGCVTFDVKFNRVASTIYINPAIAGDRLPCVISHEMRHANGDTHDIPTRPQFRIDCGDGSYS